MAPAQTLRTFMKTLGFIPDADPSLQVQFFAHLVSLRVIHPSSFSALLQSFIAVLDEPGVSYVRSRSAALCAGALSSILSVFQAD